MVALVEKDNDRTVAIRPGDILQITLPENATTGYRWTIDSYDEELVKALANQPHYPAKAMGSGGEVAFTFEAKKIGSAYRVTRAALDEFLKH